MATIENVQLGITAVVAKPGYSDISYSYELHPDAADCAARRAFTVTVGLWGEDVFDDDVLATDMDEHTIALQEGAPCEAIRVARKFEVETKLLHEDIIGDDEVFLIVEAQSQDHRASGKSNTVVGYF